MRFGHFKLIKQLHRFCSSQDVSKIRNIGISAHIDSGKTTVTERILFYTGKVNSMHEVRGKDGVGAVMDFMELEKQRGITIQSAATYTQWKDYDVNIIDTPGHVDFTVEVERALRVLDGAVLVLCAVGGVQSQTLTVNRQMKRYKVPKIAFINKLDRLGANHNRVLDQIRDKLKQNAALIQLPIGLESKNEGIIDVVNEKAIYFDEPYGLTIRVEDVPEEFREQVSKVRSELIECVANVDDEVGELFLSEKEVPIDILKAGIRRTTIKMEFTPVLMGSALKNRGVQPLLDAVIDYLPNPTEVENFALVTKTSAVGDIEEPEKIILNSERSDKNQMLSLAFKLELGKYGQLTYLRMYQGKLSRGDTIYNVRTGKRNKLSRIVRMNAQNMDEITNAYAGDIVALFGIECSSGDTFVHKLKEDVTTSMESMFIPEPVVSMGASLKESRHAENMMKGLRRFLKEDPTFKMTHDEESNQMILHGMGELHLEIYAQRIQKEYNAVIELGKPHVAFRETLTETVKFNYLHKKQSGGAGQFGRVIGMVEPLPTDKYNVIEFVDKTSGMNLSKTYVPSVEKGFRHMLEKGILAGQRISGIRMTLLDGEEHCVDSSDWAFQCAARGAMSEVMEYGDWKIVEPIMYVEVTAPSEFLSSVLNAISKRGGVILNSETNTEFCTVDAHVSLNNMFGFVGYLRSRTEGKAESTMEYSHYDVLPPDATTKLMNEHEREVAEQSKQRMKK